MATLNLNEKKIASAENLRLLSSLILSLSSKQGTIENKLINNWVASTAYIKDESFVIYDKLLYVCKISNADNTFDKNKWTCLSPVIEELTKADIEALINLNPEEISKLSDLISTEIRLDKTFSSSDTYTRIQDAIDTAKEYTNNQLGKVVKPVYKVVTNTSEVTETGYLYLISNGTNYDMYVLSSDGSVVSLGTSEVDLSNYYTKTEVDNDFLKKTDATSTYATITTVDGKVNKTDIVDNLTSTDTDKPLSANQGKVLKDEVDLKANNSDVVKKTDIVTTIDGTSTDEQIYSAKGIYNSLINKVDKPITLNTADEVNSFDRAYQSFIIGPSVAEAVGLPKAPDSTWFCINLSHFKGFKYPSQIAFEYAGIERIMYRTAHNGVWHNWRKIPTTSVADVPFTKLTLDSSVFTLVSSDACLAYSVCNGMCTIVCCGVGLVSVGNHIVTANIPKPMGGYASNILQVGAGSNIPTTPVFLIADGNGLAILSSTHTGQFWGTLTYPVAES